MGVFACKEDRVSRSQSVSRKSASRTSAANNDGGPVRISIVTKDPEPDVGIISAVILQLVVSVNLNNTAAIHFLIISGSQHQ